MSDTEFMKVRNLIPALTRMLTAVEKTGSASLWGDWTRSISDAWPLVVAHIERLEADNQRILAALNDQIDVCTEPESWDDLTGKPTEICDEYAVAWQQTETGAWETRCSAHLDETSEFIWRDGSAPA